LKYGVLIENGNHDQLLNTYPDGVYASFVKKQEQQEEDEDDQCEDSEEEDQLIKQMS